jgi:hypothetical protein
MMAAPLAVTVCFAAAASTTALKPSVYWASSPTLVNETLLLAGAGLDGAHVRLCKDAQCTAVIDAAPAIEAWAESLKMTIPQCGPPCYVELRASGGVSVVSLNAPDIWWAMTGSPATASSQLPRKPLGAALRAAVQIGDTVRIFGRSLAWSFDSSSCLSAATRRAVAGTKLVLTPGGASVAAVMANCYEATFSSSNLSSGQYTAVLTTAWGPSEPFELTLTPKPVVTPVRLEVIPDFQGNLSSALFRAAELVKGDPAALVNIMLGAREYTIATTVELPERTSLVGDGIGVSTLVFDVLHPPSLPGAAPTYSKPMRGQVFYSNVCKACHNASDWRTQYCLAGSPYPNTSWCGHTCGGCATWMRNCSPKECPNIPIGTAAEPYREYWALPHSFLLIDEHSALSEDKCRNDCGNDLRCNAWTFLPPPRSPSACVSKLQTLCAAKREGSFKCVQCTEAHAAALESSGCTEANRESWCHDKTRVLPSPAEPRVGGNCQMFACPNASSSIIASAPVVHGNSTARATSGWILGRQPQPLPVAGILITGNGNQLLNFSLRVATAYPFMPAIWMQINASGFVAAGLNLSLMQAEVSNVFKIEGYGFELINNTMNQEGGCSPHWDWSSSTIRLHSGRAGRLAYNSILWQCIAYGFDVSDQIIFEDNLVKTQNLGILDGSSNSAYDTGAADGTTWEHHPGQNPSSRFWSVARNTFSRPSNQSEKNFPESHETMTTDGPGAFAMAQVSSAQGTSVKLKWLVWVSPPLVGTTLVVLGGPGRGQTRILVGIGIVNGSIQLDRPLDGWVATADGQTTETPSIVAVVPSVGSKLFVGNRFNWTQIVQFYGNTNKGVIADNAFDSCNVVFDETKFKKGSHVGNGAAVGVGECYHGADPLFFTEFRGNGMHASDGIVLHDSGPTTEWECSKYRGPWVAWSVVRANSLTGISKAARLHLAAGQKPQCASVVVLGERNPATGRGTSDIVGEQNVFDCPEGGNSSMPYNFSQCQHCMVRP